MKRELARFLAFLLLAAGFHLAAAWGWGRWGGREDQVEALPRLDLTSVELSLSSKDAQSAQPADETGRREDAPAMPAATAEPPMPNVSAPEDARSVAEIKSAPPVAPQFTVRTLLPAPPKDSTDTVVEVPPMQTASSEPSMVESAKVEVPPAPTAEFRPKYPALCRRRGEEGIVSLDIEVDVFGHAAGVSVAISSGFAKLDAAAVEAVRSARFTPATSGGNPVPGRIRIPVAFRLTK